MVVIRLARTGAKKKPFYHVVATDKRSPRDGRYIEQLGYYNPVARGNELRLQLKQERIEHWLKEGAKPSERVQKLLSLFAKGDVQAKPVKVHQPKPKPAAKPEATETADAGAADNAADADKPAE